MPICISPDLPAFHILSEENIFVMDSGRLVDDGVHAELLSRCKIYQEIYASQMKGGEDHGVPATEC